jgi:hypothetical protein
MIITCENAFYIGAKNDFNKTKKLRCDFIYPGIFPGSCKNGRGFSLTNLMGEENQEIQQMSEEIIRCLTSKDEESLKKLFCEKIRKQSDFDGRIRELTDFFVCKSYLDADIKTSAGGGESREGGKRTDWYVSPSIPYIEVLYDKDPSPSAEDLDSRYYSVHYFWSIINEKDKSLEGLQYIRVELLNVGSVTVGKSEYMKEVPE